MVLRKPGQFARQRYRRLLGPIILLMGVGLMMALLGLRWWPLSLFALPVFGIEEWLQRHRNPLPWLEGAWGEEAVGRVLAELEGEGYQTLHDVEMAHGNIDHVVVGPTGVFAIETKHWNGVFYPKRGRLVCNGVDATRVVRQVTGAAMEVARRLRRVGVQGYVTALVVSTKAPVRGKPLSFRTASVLELSDLVQAVRGGQPVLSEAEISRAVAGILGDDVMLLPDRRG